MRFMVTLVALVLSVSAGAQSTVFQRGDSVRVLPGTSQSGDRSDLALQVVAVPNDRIRATDSGLYVNDVAVSGFSSDFLLGIVRVPPLQTVPEGHYFVMGEQRSNNDVSRYWGIHAAGRLVHASRF